MARFTCRDPLSGAADHPRPSGKTSAVRSLGSASGATSLTNDTFGFGVAWLPDSRHVVYFTGTLPFPTTMGYGVAMSPDGRTLYYAGAETEANIWLVRRAPSENVRPGSE